MLVTVELKPSSGRVELWAMATDPSSPCLKKKTNPVSVIAK